MWKATFCLSFSHSLTLKITQTCRAAKLKSGIQWGIEKGKERKKVAEAGAHGRGREVLQNILNSLAGLSVFQSGDRPAEGSSLNGWLRDYPCLSVVEPLLVTKKTNLPLTLALQQASSLTSK